MDPFIGEIRIMPYNGNFITRGWAPCNGQLIDIRQNTALFSLLGTTFGGNGTTTFGVPNLNGRAVVGAGITYRAGTAQGTESVTLTGDQTPMHVHSISATVPVSIENGSQNAAQGGFFAANGQEQYGSGASGQTANVLSGNTDSVGQGQPHENRMPFLTLGYFIAIQGEFPQRQ